MSTPTFQNCVCSNELFSLKNNIYKFFSTQIFAVKVGELIKTIIFLKHYAPLWSKANFKKDHVYVSKLCLLKWFILLEKQHFGSVKHSNILNESRWVNKNHFLSYTLCILVKVSKLENWPHPVFRTVSGQTCRFI